MEEDLEHLLPLGHSMVVILDLDILDSEDTLGSVVLDSDTLVFIKFKVKTALAAVFFFFLLYKS